MNPHLFIMKVKIMRYDFRDPHISDMKSGGQKLGTTLFLKKSVEVRTGWLR